MNSQAGKGNAQGLVCSIAVILMAIAELSFPGLAIAAQDAVVAAEGARSRPTFEVASVKPSHSHVVGLFVYPGGRVVASACPFRYLMMVAFRVQNFQIKGGPRWVDEQAFDIEAKPPASSVAARFKPNNPKLPPSEEQCEMLQALLIDRFRLKYHREFREGKIYVLTVARRRLLLKPTEKKDEFPWAGLSAGSGGGLRGVNITMSQLATRLSGWVGCPVLNKTGLNGSFDFDDEDDSGDSASNTDRTSLIITSLNTLGLKLRQSKGPVETLMIDHVEKPSAN
jgi:uncharacterized protein (TIGR03435 family)